MKRKKETKHYCSLFWISCCPLPQPLISCVTLFSGKPIVRQPAVDELSSLLLLSTLTFAMTGSDTSGSLNPIKRFNDLYSSLLLTDGTAHRLSRIESSLRSLTYFVPGQSLSSESLYTGLNLLSLYHDALLSRTSSNSGSSLSLSGTSPHTRYTKWWIQQSRLYKAIARLLSVLSYTQLMLEMAARKYRGEKGRWRVVLGLESLK